LKERGGARGAHRRSRLKVAVASKTVAPISLRWVEVDERSRGIARRVAAYFTRVRKTQQAGAKGTGA
jgi:hypothetical protein